jgi:hypothetical protein
MRRARRRRRGVTLIARAQLGVIAIAVAGFYAWLVTHATGILELPPVPSLGVQLVALANVLHLGERTLAVILANRRQHPWSDRSIS